MSGVTKFNLLVFFVLILVSVVAGVALNAHAVHILYVDIGIIFFGGIGFFTALFEASKMLPRGELTHEENKLRNQLFFLKTMAGYKKNEICRTFTKGPMSPPSFEEDQRQHNIACEWASPIIAKIERLSDEHPPEIKSEFYSEPPSDVNEKWVSNDCAELIQHIERYKSVYARVAKKRIQSSTHPVEEILVFFLPLLASVAISLSLFKAIYWAPPL